MIFSEFLSCISQLFTVFWKFLSCIVLFFHEILYCIPVLLKKIAVGGLIKQAYYKTFFTYIRTSEYVLELFFYKRDVQNKGKSAFVYEQVTIFFRTLTSKKPYFLYATYTRTRFFKTWKERQFKKNTRP